MNRHTAIFVALLMGTFTGCKEDDEDTGSSPGPTDDTGSTSGTGADDDPEPVGESGSTDESGGTTLVEEEGEKDCAACGSPFCNSVVVDDQCECEAGYEWNDPNDPDDFECVRMTGKGGSTCPDPNSFFSEGQCFCDAGYDWCNAADLDDLSCCVVEDATTSG